MLDLAKDLEQKSSFVNLPSSTFCAHGYERKEDAAGLRE